MKLDEAIKVIEDSVDDPTRGLPEDVFLMASRLVPSVNVDLLIHDELGRTLLAWRDDPYCGTGCHIPGGVIRLREPMQDRVHKVFRTEIGKHPYYAEPSPVVVNEIFSDYHRSRGHFISLLFRCFVISNIELNGSVPIYPGYLQWHETCPLDLIKCHEIYRQYITRKRMGA